MQRPTHRIRLGGITALAQSAQAAAVVDRISGRYSPDVAADWARVEAYLRLAYRAIEAATQGAKVHEPSDRQP